MSYCLNPICPQPQNPDTHSFCQNCGWRLRLGNRYEAVRPLGQGLNSRTFWGRDRSTLVTPQCLIKSFTLGGANQLEQTAAVKNWRQDIARLASASHHPQIPNVLGYFERADTQFLVQDFLTAPHLDQWMAAKSGPFNSHEVIEFLQDVLPILHHLHSRQILHRDIKPVNFRRAVGQPHWWLVDLGASKCLATKQVTRPGTLIGSAEYAAPEQLRGYATFASDLYSLGLVCLHLLTGLRPFDLFDTTHGCWCWHSIVPDILPSLASLIDSLIQPQLEQRLATATAAMTALGMTPIVQPPTITVSSVSPPSWPIEQKIDVETKPLTIAALSQYDRLLVLTESGNLQVRSLTEPQYCLHTHTLNTHAPTTILCAHPRLPYFVIGDRQGHLAVWQISEDVFPESLPHVIHGITQIHFTPDGNTLIIADNHSTIFCLDWLTRTVQHRWQEHAHAITSLVTNDDGTLLASGDTQGQVKLWHLGTAESLKTLSHHRGAITALCWLTGENALVSAGWDATLHWCCPATGSLQQSVTAQHFLLPIKCLRAHPSKPYAIAGSQEGTLLCWPFHTHAQGQSNVTQPVAITTIGSSPILSLICNEDNHTGTQTLWAVTQAGYLSMIHLAG